LVVLTWKKNIRLSCRRRKPNESLRELAQDVRRLTMLAYPGDRSTMSERLAKEHFICAFDDPDLELKVREKARFCSQVCTARRGIQKRRTTETFAHE